MDKNIVSSIPYYRSFEADDFKYWRQYGIGQCTLKKYNVMALKKVVFEFDDRSVVEMAHKRGELRIYAYLFDGLGFKMHLDVNDDMCFLAGRVPTPYVFGDRQLPDTGMAVYIVGNEKDVMSLAARGLSAVCFDSESPYVPGKIIKDLARRFNYIVFLFDGNIERKRQLKNQARGFRKKGYDNVIWMSLPLSGTIGNKSVSDYFHNGASIEDFEHLTQHSIKLHLGQQGKLKRPRWETEQTTLTAACCNAVPKSLCVSGLGQPCQP